MQTQRLQRSSQEKMLFGVAGGLAQYWALDPVLVRVGFVVLALVSAGLGIVLYIALAIIMPREGAVPDGEAGPVDEERMARRRNGIAIVLIVLGGVLLLGNLGPWLDWRDLWPLVLIGIGVAIIIDRVRRS